MKWCNILLWFKTRSDQKYHSINIHFLQYNQPTGCFRTFYQVGTPSFKLVILLELSIVVLLHKMVFPQLINLSDPVTYWMRVQFLYSQLQLLHSYKTFLNPFALKAIFIRNMNPVLNHITNTGINTKLYTLFNNTRL